MQPSESSLISLGFLKVFMDLPLPLSLEYVFLVANASIVLFIIYQVFSHVMGSGGTPVCALESPGVLVELEAPPFIAVLVPPDPMLLAIRCNGVDSRFFRRGSTKLLLVPGDRYQFFVG